MEFIKKDVVNKIVMLNQYEVVIETMFGDADGYEEVVISGIEIGEENLMVDLIKTLIHMKNEYPNGRGGCDDYYHIDGFNKWFNAEYMSEDEYEQLSYREKFLTSEWPYCGDIQATFQRFVIYLYDEHGTKYNVEVK